MLIHVILWSLFCFQAQTSFSESSQRLDLIRHSLELQSANAMELKKELESYTMYSSHLWREWLDIEKILKGNIWL